ncbi:MAG: hypothetical protein R3F11_05235 [Verrucomicrobiales bacterium]
MKPTAIFSAAILLAASLCPAQDAAPPEPDRAVVFSAMGCGPYTPPDWEPVRGFVAKLSAEKKSEFLVHLGDIIGGKVSSVTGVDRAYCAKIRELLTAGSDLPTFIVPGDNEWNDAKDPDAAWMAWKAELGDLDQRTKCPWPVQRQTGRDENFAFTRSGIAFVGINLVGGRVHDKEEWKLRHADDAAWIKERLASDGLRGAVILC